jgi:hypothetical protein
VLSALSVSFRYIRISDITAVFEPNSYELVSIQVIGAQSDAKPYFNGRLVGIVAYPEFGTVHNRLLAFMYGYGV